MALLRDRIGAARVWFAGRLATYRYLDMDECMRQALDCADAIVATQEARGSTSRR